MASTQQKRSRQIKRPMTPPPATCRICFENNLPCSRRLGEILCDQCKRNGSICETVHTHHSRKVDRRTLDLLPPGARYKSSSELLSYLRSQGKRKSKLNHSQGQPRSPLILSPSTTFKHSEMMSIGAQYLDNYLPPISSTGPTAKLTDVTLAKALGDHLLELSISEIKLSRSFTYVLKSLPDSWSSYDSIKKDPEGSIENHYVQIWTSLLLVLGAQSSSHSSLLGPLALSKIPSQSLTSSLDLRVYGQYRHTSLCALLKDLKEKVISNSTPLKRKGFKSLSILALIMMNFSMFDEELGRECNKISLQVFEGMWKDNLKEGKYANEGGELVEQLGTWWDLIVYRDNLFSIRHCLEPLLKDAHYRRYSDLVDPSYLIDPFEFFLHPIFPSHKGFRNHYWANTQATTRLIAISRHRLRNITLSSVSLSICLELSKLIHYRTNWRNSHFTLKTSASRPPHYVIKQTGVEETLYTSITEVHHRCLQSFTVYRIVKEEMDKWKWNSPESEVKDQCMKLKTLMENYADEEVKNLLIWTDGLMEDERRKGNDSIILGFNAIKGLLETIDSLPTGWKYLANWSVKFPQFRGRLLSVINRSKIFGWQRKEWGDKITEFEDEMITLFPFYANLIDSSNLLTSQKAVLRSILIEQEGSIDLDPLDEDETTLEDFASQWQPVTSPLKRLAPRSDKDISAHQSSLVSENRKEGVLGDVDEVLNQESTILDFPSFIDELMSIVNR